MKKFMILYMAKGAKFEKAMKEATPEQRKQSMDAWMKWMGANQKSMVDGGAPMGKTMRVDQKGAAADKNAVGGYSILNAKTHEAAAKLFKKDHPHLMMPGAWVEITEILPMAGA